MAAVLAARRHRRARPPRDARAIPLGAGRCSSASRSLYLTLFLFVPLFAVFFEALKKGWGVYLAAISEPDALGRDPPHAPRRGHRRAAEPRLRHRRRLGDREVRLPRQERCSSR